MGKRGLAGPKPKKVRGLNRSNAEVNAPGVGGAIVMLLTLLWIWEVWEWSDAEVTFVGVALLLYGAYTGGWVTGRYPQKELRDWPGWVQLGFFAAVIGIVLVIGANASPCELGECEPG